MTDTLKLFRTTSGIVVQYAGRLAWAPPGTWDALVNGPDPLGLFKTVAGHAPALDAEVLAPERLLAPIGTQEVWAAGVTYFRSRTARMEESKAAGGGDFYDRVYSADRPELFFKATARRVVGPGAPVRTRRDARWSVPEPELALVVNSRGRIVGYTIGNDMSARDIEGENPLYLPQAKVYAASCALGPCVLLGAPLPSDTEIRLTIRRAGTPVFEGRTTLATMKRTPEELVDWLYRDNEFPEGCVLLTGTGIVPPDAFTLADGDVVSIEVPPIGVLENQVAASAGAPNPP